jgi:hypothetical protein
MQLATMRTMKADQNTEVLEEENSNTCGGHCARFFDKYICGGDNVHTKAGKLVLNTYSRSSTENGKIKAKKLPRSYFRFSGFLGIGKCVPLAGRHSPFNAPTRGGWIRMERGSLTANRPSTSGDIKGGWLQEQS